MNLCFALWRTNKRSQVIIYRLIGWVGAKGVGLSTKPIRRTCQSLISEPGGEPSIDELSRLRHLDYRQESGRWAVNLRITVRQQQRTNTLRMARHQKLRDRASAVVRNEVGVDDRKLIHQRDDHCHLRVRRDALAVRDLCITHRHKIGSDASAVSRQTIERSAPLKAIERKAVQKERCVSCSTLDIRDPPERCLRVLAHIMEYRGRGNGAR